jgi:BirA family biotin operon repressor/biotin-[acetyl-CoA-carboxylase] ligase
LSAKNKLQLNQLPAFILTASQQMGRGQRGRSWITEPQKNLLFSFAIPFPKDFNTALFLLTIAQQVADVLEVHTSAPIRIKWPNDLYIESKKLGGILCEATYLANKPKMLVCGIGINVNQTDFGTLGLQATSLKKRTGKTFDLLSLLQLVFQSLDNAIQNKYWKDADMVEKINSRFLYRNKSIRLEVNGKDTGIASLIGIDAIGKLWFRKENEEFVSFDHENIRISRLD